ncbi:hypothetical protein CI105_08490 [Candidatus Izimaplasma bacterium ZiA1]|nr:hypothetical protein CI105_08490 [Candidatus Izimaplasma bacterium ZiA1]
MKYTESSRELLFVLISSIVVLPVLIFFNQIIFIYIFIVFQNLVIVFHKHPIINLSSESSNSVVKRGIGEVEKKPINHKSIDTSNRWICSCGQSNFADVLRCKNCNKSR